MPSTRFQYFCACVTYQRCFLHPDARVYLIYYPLLLWKRDAENSCTSGDHMVDGVHRDRAGSQRRWWRCVSEPLGGSIESGVSGCRQERSMDAIARWQYEEARTWQYTRSEIRFQMCGPHTLLSVWTDEFTVYLYQPRSLIVSGQRCHQRVAQ